MSVNAPNGPENVPLLNIVKTFPLIVSVFENDKLVKEEKIDYGNVEHRKWLGRLTYWACNQGYTVETRRNETPV